MKNEIRITKPTWIVHGICNGRMLVHHTEGLTKYGSLELELNLPIGLAQAGEIINLIGIEIANGKLFKDGDIDNELFTSPTAFKEVKGINGNGAKHLRIIIPDKNLRFPWDEGCQEPFKSQMPYTYLN